ncbi:hypothetical protein WA026_004018 [Henosepilachna vigintioctopunctata]|uniref:Ankyrin repeat protein n=1 Tax=Henosepilachna vigintioctopunctata TaxID=420089 RepID=A0AAW1UHG6_9CUCU
MLSKILLTNGANVNCVYQSILTPLHSAAYKDNLEITTLLLEFGARTDISLPSLGTPLHLVCQKSNKEMIKLLLNKGSNVNSLNENNETPLHIAVKYVKLVTVETLLEFGASVNCPDKFDRTPLDYAVRYKYYQICEVLIKNGADIEYRNTKFETPLHTACRGSGNGNIIKLLIRSGANVNALNNVKETPIFHMVKNYSKYESYETLKIILCSRANPDILNKNGVSPLMLAVNKSNLAAMRILLRFSADIDLQNEYGETALHIACHGKNDVNVVALLLSGGASINIKNHSRETPVMIAFLNSNITIQNMISEHILKLKCANLYVSKLNQEFTEIIINETWSMQNNVIFSRQNALLKLACENELNFMKQRSIPGTNLTLYNILIGTNNQIYQYTRNKKVSNYFRIHSLFLCHVYGDLIINNLRKGFKRNKLLEIISGVLPETSKYFFRLPWTCVEKILSFLPNSDLIKIIDACKYTFRKL